MAGVRITGRFGTLTLAGNVIAEVIDWTLTVDSETVRCGIKGETIEPAAVGGLNLAVTAERIMTDSGGAALLKGLLDHYGGATSPKMLYDNATPGPPGAEKTIVLNEGASGAVITGAGVVTRARANAPRDLSRDNFEFTMTSLTSVTP